MIRYIRCSYCGSKLGEDHRDNEEPLDEIYCIGCYTEYKEGRPENERILDELVAPYE